MKAVRLLELYNAVEALLQSRTERVLHCVFHFRNMRFRHLLCPRPVSMLAWLLLF